MTRSLILSLFSFLVLTSFSNVAFANCEHDLISEFSREPDDLQNGLISTVLPVTADNMIESYGRGIFPWMLNEEGNGMWFSPPQRGILYLTDYEIPSGIRKTLRQLKARFNYRVEFDKDFDRVVENCAEAARKDEKWLSPAHVAAMKELFKRGLAHSVEVYEGNLMVGGLYGVFTNGYFSGESMFHLRSDVNKFAYAELIQRLIAGGHKFLDTQQALVSEVETEHGLMKKKGLSVLFGAGNVSRDEARRLIDQAKQENLAF